MLLAQAAATESFEPWARFLLLLTLQGGALAILAYLAVRGLPQAMNTLAVLQAEAQDRFDRRNETLAAEVHSLSETVTRLTELLTAQARQTPS